MAKTINQRKRILCVIMCNIWLSRGFAKKEFEYSVQQNAGIFDQLSKLESEELIEFGKKYISSDQTVIDTEISKSFTVPKYSHKY